MTDQIFPAAEPFRKCFSTSHILYGRLAPWQGTEGGSGQFLNCDPGSLHDGWTQQTSNGPLPYASCNAFDGGNILSRDVCVFAAALPQVTDGIVTMVPAVRSDGGLSYFDFVSCGVAVRCSGGTLDQSGSKQEEFHQNANCYLFVHVRRSNGEKLLLLRCQGGTVTSLASTDLSAVDTPDGFYSTGEPKFLPLKMQVRIAKVGNSVELTCVRTSRQPTGGQSGGPAFVDVEVFGGAITDPNPLPELHLPGTADEAKAFAGFVLSSGRNTAAGTKAAITCRAFTVAETVSGTDTIVYQELWRRGIPAAAQEITDQAGITGRSLQSGWVGDLMTQVPPFTTAGTLVGADRIYLADGAPSGIYAGAEVGWSVRQNPETSSDQGCQATVWLENTGSAENREIGLIVRGSFSGGDLRSERADGEKLSLGRTGYLLLVNHIAGFQPALELRRVYQHPVSGAQEQIMARANPPGIAAGVPIDLSIEVVNTDQNTVELDCRFFGAQLAWQASPAFPVQDGKVVDASNLRIVQGSLMGVFARLGGSQSYTSNPQASVRNWARRAVTVGGGGGPGGPGSGGGSGGPGGEGEELPTVASIVVPSEAYNRKGILVTPSSWPIEESMRREPKGYEMESGHMPMQARQITTRRRWRIVARNVTPEQRQKLEQFWENRDGPVIPFTFRHPRTKEELIVRFFGRMLFHRVNWSAGGKSKSEEYAFDLEEVYRPTRLSGEPGIDPPKPPTPPREAGGPSIPGGGEGDLLDFYFGTSVRNPSATTLALGDANNRPNLSFSASFGNANTRRIP